MEIISQWVQLKKDLDSVEGTLRSTRGGVPAQPPLTGFLAMFEQHGPSVIPYPKWIQEAEKDDRRSVKVLVAEWNRLVCEINCLLNQDFMKVSAPNAP